MRFLRETNNILVVVAQFIPIAQFSALEIETTGNSEDQRVDYRYNREHRRAQLLRKFQRARPQLLTRNNQQREKQSITLRLKDQHSENITSIN